jgi:PII-like signaling protein
MQVGRARKLTIYVTESDTRHGRPLYEVLFELARKRGLRGATVVRGLMGFGAGGTIHVAHPDLASRLPVRVEIIDSAAAIEDILGDVCELVGDGLVVVCDVDVVKGAGHEGETRREAVVEHVALAGQAQMWRIFVSATEEIEGRLLYEAIVERLRQLDVAGATVLRGEAEVVAVGEGHGQGEIVIVVVDAAAKLGAIGPALEEMVRAGLILRSDVDVVFYRATGRG